MKLFFCTIAITCLSSSLAQTSSKWEDFKVKFNKKYTNSTVEGARRKMFEALDAKIVAHNAKATLGEVGYTMAHNKFSDSTPIERSRVKGFKPRNATRNTGSFEELPMPMLRALPTTVDFRTSACMTPIQDQGYCGSCWAFSATALLDYYNCKKKANVLTKFSQQHLVSCDKVDLGCNGGNYDDAWTWVKTNGGQCSLSAYAYTSGTTAVDGTCKTCTKVGTVTGYKYIPRNETYIMNALATIGPVAVSLDATDNFTYYSGGVFVDTTCTLTPNHAINIVGYGTTSTGVKYWIVRNSWGTEWGVNGYGLMRRGVNMCGIEADVAYPTL